MASRTSSDTQYLPQERATLFDSPLFASGTASDTAKERAPPPQHFGIGAKQPLAPVMFCRRPGKLSSSWPLAAEYAARVPTPWLCLSAHDRRRAGTLTRRRPMSAGDAPAVDAADEKEFSQRANGLANSPMYTVVADARAPSGTGGTRPPRSPSRGLPQVSDGGSTRHRRAPSAADRSTREVRAPASEPPSSAHVKLGTILLAWVHGIGLQLRDATARGRRSAESCRP